MRRGPHANIGHFYAVFTCPTPKTHASYVPSSAGEVTVCLTVNNIHPLGVITSLWNVPNSCRRCMWITSDTNGPMHPDTAELTSPIPAHSLWLVPWSLQYPPLHTPYISPDHNPFIWNKLQENVSTTQTCFENLIYCSMISLLLRLAYIVH